MMRLARDLGYTLSELSERMTFEEVQLWGLMYQAESEEIEEANKNLGDCLRCTSFVWHTTYEHVIEKDDMDVKLI